MQRSLIALLTIAALCGAARADAPKPTNVSPPATHAPDFHDGYSDGCSHVTFGDAKHETRYKTSVSFRTDWSTGFYNCQTHSQIQNTEKPNVHLFGLF